GIGKRHRNHAKRPITLALQGGVVGEYGIDLAVDASLNFIGRYGLPNRCWWTKIATVCASVPGVGTRRKRQA
ncbi:MAG: hypothetical protein ACXVJ2_10350, partial [Candidatus Angelobacter sp.]